MSKPAVGQQFLKSLSEALGLGERKVRRLVMDVTVNEPVRVFAEEFVGEERLSCLLAEVPNLDPYVEFVDRVTVEPTDGTKIVVRRVDTADSEERRLCHVMLSRFAKAKTEDERNAIRQAVYGAEG